MTSTTMSLTTTKKKKAERTLTLGAFSYGHVRENGIVTTADVEEERLCFVESMTPIFHMLQELHDWNLGTKLKVTIEIIEK